MTESERAPVTPIWLLRRRRHGGSRTLAALLILMAGLCPPVLAEEAESAHEAAPSTHRSTEPSDPLSHVEGSGEAWSVSQTDAGCYLMSPYRKDSSRLALGHHPTLGLGLFAVGFALAISGKDGTEPVIIRADGQELNKAARLVGAKLLYIPLEKPEADAALRELKNAGALWLVLRHTWIVHGGQMIQAAITQYGVTCLDAANKPG